MGTVKKTLAKQTLVLVAVLAFSGCVDSNSYEGDGELTRYGGGLMYGGYWLDLGVLSSSRHKYSFELKNLPNKRFIFGFQNEANESLSKLDVMARFVITNESGDIEMDKTASRWVLGSEGPMYVGVGMSFHAREKQGYKLAVDILSDDVPTGLRLVAASAGWK